MKPQIVVLLILLVAVLLSPIVASADPPEPIQVRAVVSPPAAHVGDTMTFTCLVIPLRGGTVTDATASFWPGLSDVRYIRGLEDQGPLIWQHLLVTTLPATDEASCWGEVTVDGETYSATDAVTVTILP